VVARVPSTGAKGRRFVTNLLSPSTWAQGEPADIAHDGVWRTALRSGPDCDGIVLCHLEPGATYKHDDTRPTNLLVLNGTIAVGAQPSARVAHAGTYTRMGIDPLRVEVHDAPALALLLSGPGLGDVTSRFGSPPGWISASPDMQVLPLSGPHADEELAERVVGFAHLEPGGSVPDHPHSTAHIFVFLDGEAEDEITLPDGRKEEAQRHRGDFVVYPFPAQHRLTSRTGCSIFFVHEPVLYGGGS
jgi:quercetin dioxygenase-like cupin family protein